MIPFTLSVVPVTLFEQNCSIFVCKETNEAAIVDPGGDLPRIREALGQLAVKPTKILITHGHIDHAGSAAELAEDLGLPVEGPHIDDKGLLAFLPQSGLRFGISDARALTPDRWLAEGDTVTVGKVSLDVLHCPGHSPGSVVFVWRAPGAVAPDAGQGFALMGDVLFRGSVGRTDLPGANHDQLMASIRDKVLPLGDELVFLPGHGPTSRIGDERMSNPFIQGL